MKIFRTNKKVQYTACLAITGAIQGTLRTFFPYCITEWNNLTVEIRNSKLVSALKKLIKCKKKRKLDILNL